MNLRLTACLIAGLACLPNLQADANDFRVETDIYVESQKDPVIQTLTLFTDGVVYDFLQPSESLITTFEPERGQFVLLDSQRRVKTTVTTEQILEFTAQLKAEAEEGRQQSLVDPSFEHELDKATGWLVLSSDRLIYRAQGQIPKDPSAVQRYQQFADWYARLNAIDPSNLPPSGRIELNKAIADQKWIPHEIERTVTVGEGLSTSKHVVRSRHLPIWQLSQSDRDRIALVGRYKAEFEAVSFQDFRSPVPAAGKKSGK